MDIAGKIIGIFFVVAMLVGVSIACFGTFVGAKKVVEHEKRTGVISETVVKIVSFIFAAIMIIGLLNMIVGEGGGSNSDDPSVMRR